MRLVSALAGILLAVGIALPAGASQPAAIHFSFAPQAERTISYRISDTLTSTVSGGETRKAVWSHRLEVEMGASDDTGTRALVTVRDVRLEHGEAGVDYLLARAIEGVPLEVMFDRGGFIREVVGWQGIKTGLKRRLPATVGEDNAAMVAAILDRLDALHGATLVGRPLAIVSAAYGMSFRVDRGETEFDDWQGGSAYVFPGRTAKSHLIGTDGKNDRRVLAEWKFETDPAVAAAHLGPLFMELMPDMGSGRDLADAQSMMRRWLAGGRIELDETGAALYDIDLRVVRNALSDVTITIGDLRREQRLMVRMED